MDIAVNLKDVSKRYDDFKLENLNICLESGYVLGLIGPNGAGKSTTIKLLLNHIKADSGQIEINGKSYDKSGPSIKNDIGFVLDQDHYYSHLTIRKIGRALSPFYTEWSQSKFESYIERFSLPFDKKISQLSKGMKMKFSLAIALSHNAKLLLMDEPTSGLDPIVRSELIEILSGVMLNDKKSIIFSTHITSDLDKIADYILLLNGGKTLLNEDKDALIERHAIVKGPKELSHEVSDHAIGIKKHKYGFEALTCDKNRFLNDSRLIFEKPTLDDIMLYYTKGESRC
jgi:ABC-2 type transport system ATP-binding protein